MLSYACITLNLTYFNHFQFILERKLKVVFNLLYIGLLNNKLKIERDDSILYYVRNESISGYHTFIDYLKIIIKSS